MLGVRHEDIIEHSVGAIQHLDGVIQSVRQYRKLGYNDQIWRNILCLDVGELINFNPLLIYLIALGRDSAFVHSQMGCSFIGGTIRIGMNIQQRVITVLSLFQ